MLGYVRLGLQNFNRQIISRIHLFILG